MRNLIKVAVIVTISLTLNTQNALSEIVIDPGGMYYNDTNTGLHWSPYLDYSPPDYNLISYGGISTLHSANSYEIGTLFNNYSPDVLFDIYEYNYINGGTSYSNVSTIQRTEHSLYYVGGVAGDGLDFYRISQYIDQSQSRTYGITGYQYIGSPPFGFEIPTYGYTDWENVGAPSSSFNSSILSLSETTGYGHWVVAGNSVSTVPEPSTFVLISCALVGLVSYGRRRFKK